MYRLIENRMTHTISVVLRLEDSASIPFDPANTDYQTFKSQINANEAELQDADGNTMTAEQAKAFIKELP